MRPSILAAFLIMAGYCRAFWLWDWLLHGQTAYDGDEVVEGISEPPNFATNADGGGGGGVPSSSSSSFPIKNVVILVLENRSFDNICGFFDYNDSIDGVKKNPFCNTFRVNETHSDQFCTSNKAKLVFPQNPSHEFDQISYQVFGSRQPNPGTPPTMTGFAQGRKEDLPSSTTTDLNRLFECHDPTKIPVLHTLAKEFVLFDRWFASVPSCTLPNRAFIHAHTSNGVLKNLGLTPILGWPNKSIWNIFDEHRISWVNYFQEFPTLSLFSQLRTFSHWSNFKYFWSHFEKDVKAGTLPTISFIDPIYGMLPFFRGKNNDGHGPTDFHRTEVMVKNMYDMLRKSPQWDNLLWIITFDEHGGFPDHVSPPQGVPSPDNIKAANGFAFDRLGVRVPAIMVSPWLKRGKVVHNEGFSPFPNSEYEHSSIGATIFKLLNIDATLTKRTSFAKTFEPLFSELKEPRTDCPLEMPAPFKEASCSGCDVKGVNDEEDFEEFARQTRGEFLNPPRRRRHRRGHDDEESDGNLYLEAFKGFLQDMNATQREKIF